MISFEKNKYTESNLQDDREHAEPDTLLAVLVGLDFYDWSHAVVLPIGTSNTFAAEAMRKS